MVVTSSETRLRCPHCGEAWRMNDRDAILVAARLLIGAGQIDITDLIPIVPPAGNLPEAA